MARHCALLACISTVPCLLATLRQITRQPDSSQKDNLLSNLKNFTPSPPHVSIASNSSIVVRWRVPAAVRGSADHVLLVEYTTGNNDTQHTWHSVKKQFSEGDTKGDITVVLNDKDYVINKVRVRINDQEYTPSKPSKVTYIENDEYDEYEE